jgi:hypothetical protein
MRNKKTYEEMTKKELLKIAKLHGIKGRHKMNKETLIQKILEKKAPLKSIKKIEEELKNKKLREKYNENHVELLPKDPSTVYVHWEVKEQKANPTLRLMSKRKTELELPLMSNEGEGYLKVNEGKPLRAVIGIKKGKRFQKIIESPEIFVPKNTPSENKNVKWAYVNPETGKTRKKGKNPQIANKNKLEEKKKKTEKTAKTVKYIRVPKQK